MVAAYSISPRGTSVSGRGEYATAMAQKLKTGGEARPSADLVKLPERAVFPSLWPWSTPPTTAQQRVYRRTTLPGLRMPDGRKPTDGAHRLRLDTERMAQSRMARMSSSTSSACGWCRKRGGVGRPLRRSATDPEAWYQLATSANPRETTAVTDSDHARQ